MTEQKILIDEVDGYIGTLKINRPERRNALSPELLIQMHLKLKEWAENETVRAVIITGAPENMFSSGYDILSIPTEMTPEMSELMKAHNPLELALSSVKEFPYPTIALMNGYCFGAGLNLAVCCDIRIAADDIKLGMPPAKLGLVYHPEGLLQFIEAFGMPRVRELFFTARTYQGKEIRELGLVHYQLPRTEINDFARAMAADIAKNAPLSLKGMKRILAMLGKGPELSPNEQAEAERLITEGFNSEDLKEGQTAFIEKRAPVFKGK